MVVLGGDLASLGELLLDPVRETVRRRTLVSLVAAAELRTSELGPHVGGHRRRDHGAQGGARGLRLLAAVERCRARAAGGDGA